MTPPFLLFSSRHWLPPHIFFPSPAFSASLLPRGGCPTEGSERRVSRSQDEGESGRTTTACLAAPKATPLHAYFLFIQTKPCWRPDTFLLWSGTKFGRNNGLAEWAVTEAMSRQHSWWWSGFKSCLFHNGYDCAEVIRAYMIYIMDASEGNTPPFSLP